MRKILLTIMIIFVGICLSLASQYSFASLSSSAKKFNEIAKPPQLTPKQAEVANMMLEYGAIQAFFEHCNYAGYAQQFRDMRALLPPEHSYYYNMGYNDNQGNNDMNCKSGDDLWLEVEPLIKRTINVLKNSKKTL